MKYSTLFLSLSLLGLVACNSGGSGPQGDRSNQAENAQNSDSVERDQTEAGDPEIKITKKRKVDLLDDLSNFSDYKANINNYILTLKARSGSFRDAEVECQKKNILDRDNSVYASSFNQDGQIATLDVSLDVKNPVAVDFECLVTDRGMLLATKKITLKKSFVISGTKNVVASGLGFEPIETLVLDKDATLVTDGSLFTLVANELVSNNAKIITFAGEEETTTPENESGAAGGSIHIDTQIARGELSIELRGKDAGKQSNIPTMIPTIPAASASLNGVCGGSERDIDPKKKSCWGKTGAQGFTGLKGFKGMDGGASGILYFESHKENKLNLKVSYFPGKSGRGGIGGAGGHGGPGGKGSYVKQKAEHADHHGCGGRCLKIMLSSGHQYPHGAQGPKGLTGEDGDAGKNGEVIESKVIMKFEEMKWIFNTDWMNY